jgi:hypothetical protein
VWERAEERARETGIAEENQRKFGKHRRRTVTFVLDYFSVSGEGE